jgi:paraquat-inducible protein A
MKLVQSAAITNVLLIVSFILFTLGVFSPLMTVKKWFIFENTFSLIAGLLQFFHAGQYVLLVIVAVFSLVVPLAKMLLIAVVTNTSYWTDTGRHNMIHGLSLIGKWSMMDVFIVAILIVVGKFRGIAEVKIHYGLYVFAVSVILIHIVTCLIETGWQNIDMEDST